MVQSRDFLKLKCFIKVIIGIFIILLLLTFCGLVSAYVMKKRTSCLEVFYKKGVLQNQNKTLLEKTKILVEIQYGTSLLHVWFKKCLKKIFNYIAGMFTESFLRGESHIDFRTQCVIMTPAGGEVIANDVLKMRRVIAFQSSWIAVYYKIHWGVLLQPTCAGEV